MLCLALFSLRKFIRTSVDYFFYWLISRKIEEITAPESLSKLVNLFQGRIILHLNFLLKFVNNQIILYNFRSNF